MRMKKIIALFCVFVWSIPFLGADEVYFKHIDLTSDPNQMSAISIYQDKENRIWFGNTCLNVYDGERVYSYQLSLSLPGVQDNNIHSICGDGKHTLYMLADANLVSFDYKYETFKLLDIEANAIFYQDEALFYGRKNRFALLQEGSSDEEICKLSSESSILAILPWQDGWLLGCNNGLYLYRKGKVEKIYADIAVSTLFLDSKGSVWVGTNSGGVFRLYQGEWSHFTEGTDNNSLVNNQIRCVSEDENGKIWIGTFRGITIFDPSTENTRHIYQEETSGWFTRHSSIYDIAKDNQGGMWIGTYYGGLSYFNPDTERYTFYQAGMKDGGKLNGFLFGQMTEGENGDIYIATENGLINRINKYTGEIEPYKLKEPDKQPFTTSKSVWYNPENKNLYIGTFLKGLYRYSTKNQSLKALGEDILLLDQQRIISYLIDWGEYLILVTQDELYKMDKGTEEVTPLLDDVSQKEYLKGMILSCFLDERSNTLWIAQAQQELLCLDLETGRFTPNEVLNTYIGRKNVESIAGDQNGKIYMIVQRLGLLEYNIAQESVQIYNKASRHFNTDELFDVAVLRPGTVIITSHSNIYLLDLKENSVRRVFLGETSPFHNRLNKNCGIYISSDTKEIFVGGIGGILAFSEAEPSIPAIDYTIGFNSLYINNELSSPNDFSSYMSVAMPFMDSIRLPYDKNNLSIGFFSTNYRNADFTSYEYRLKGFDNQWIPTNHNMITYSSLPPGEYKLQLREINSGKEIALHIQIVPPFYLSSVALFFYFLLGVLILIWVIWFNRNQAVLKASLALERKEKEQLEELNQMKLRFYINISHELRTPLTLISNQLELVLANNGLSNSLYRRFVKIQQYTEQMNLLISEILYLRKMEQGKMSLQANYMDFIVFTQKMYDSFQDYASYKKINYQFEYKQHYSYIWFDPRQMQKVFNNLLSNAFKYTDSDGTITIRIEEENEFLLLSVEDTGCGIPEEHVEHIFERFYQIDQAVDSSVGTGIGLALTKEIVYRHGGYIRVESELGKGARFTVFLRKGDAHLTKNQKSEQLGEVVTKRILPPVVINEEEEVIPVEESAKERGRILLVEDDVELLNLLKEAFRPMYMLYTAENGRDGLKAAEEFSPDLIISDVMMPGMSGVEFCKELKHKISTSHIPVILLSARTDQEVLLEALRNGATDYIIKPFNLEMLLLKCKNIFRDQAEWVQKKSPDEKAASVELATNKQDQELLDKSIEIIERHIENKDFNIDVWCRDLAMGRTRLSMRIKAITGMTLNDFILHIKLRKCGRLLNDYDLTISEIAWKCGFSSASYMGKCFKQQYGMTPLEYRNKQKEME